MHRLCLEIVFVVLRLSSGKGVLERLVLCKLVLGLFDIRLGILYRLFCRIERALRVRRSVLGGRELGLGILYGVFGSNKRLNY